MEIFGFRIVDSLPVLYHPGMDMIVVSDPHLGVERTMTSKGSYVPKFQLGDLKDDIREALDNTDAGRILINGDLKQEFRTTGYGEEEEIREFLEFLDRLTEEIIFVQGNHDTFLEGLFDDYNLELNDRHLESGVLFMHGDSKVEEEKYDTLVMGHEHPALKLEDDVGVTEKIDCFLYGEMRNGRNILVMPAFSSISQGSNVNEIPQDQLLSPILRNQVDTRSLKAVGVSREAGLFEFPEISRI